MYVKVTEPRGLNSKFEGPYFITSRPSRTTVEVRVGSFADGTPRLQVFNWSLCKIAHMRPDATEGSRPMLGRRPDPKPTRAQLSDNSSSSNMAEESDGDAVPTGRSNKQTENSSGAKIQTAQPDPPRQTRPTRSTRNPNPLYVDAVGAIT